jgi:hypothetical protein
MGIEPAPETSPNYVLCAFTAMLLPADVTATDTYFHALHLATIIKHTGRKERRKVEGFCVINIIQTVDNRIFNLSL